MGGEVVLEIEDPDEFAAVRERKAENRTSVAAADIRIL
jgi:hypothetical protein